MKRGIITQGRFTLEGYYMKGQWMSSDVIVYIAGERLHFFKTVTDSSESIESSRQYRSSVFGTISKALLIRVSKAELREFL